MGIPGVQHDAPFAANVIPNARVDLLARGHVGGAHGRGVLTATAAAVALLEIAHKRPIPLDVAEHGQKRQLDLMARALAEVRVNREPAVRDDLARVQHVLGIEELLELAGGFHEFRAEVLG